ncbi:DUF3261 domain-containing protein [Endozoicomonas sp. SM1973]|uniref:DUF3261 domain-containing protein n=1 Tax=Spartinivicinus marinus TaxID=2994442 RepID=A0A853ID79_9GAMM|nr:DUF3261 domain-containing protein [Spartinivicinus marinus]MCX4025405.1 DUF3261 domain-containing protein [Spartinivicinus marinus]NYZ65366.1 DUF3261 domain-containing protein [Spartinivicinus marinus]
MILAILKKQGWLKALLAIIGCGCLLSGCGFRTINQTVKGEFAQSSVIPLPTVQALGKGFSATQELVGNFQGKENPLLFQLESDGSKLVMVGLTSIGHRLITLEYQQEKLSAELSPLLPEQLKADYLLSDFLLAFANVKAIKSAFNGSAYQVAETAQDDIHTRIIYNKSKPIIEIKYDHADPWRATVQLKHLVYGYSLQIKTIEKQLL